MLKFANHESVRIERVVLYLLHSEFLHRQLKPSDVCFANLIAIARPQCLHKWLSGINHLLINQLYKSVGPILAKLFKKLISMFDKMIN